MRYFNFYFSPPVEIEGEASSANIQYILYIILICVTTESCELLWNFRELGAEMDFINLKSLVQLWLENKKIIHNSLQYSIRK